MPNTSQDVLIETPVLPAAEQFSDAAEAVDRLELLYRGATEFLSQHFRATMTSGQADRRYRAFYP